MALDNAILHQVDVNSFELPVPQLLVVKGRAAMQDLTSDSNNSPTTIAVVLARELVVAIVPIGNQIVGTFGLASTTLIPEQPL